MNPKGTPVRFPYFTRLAPRNQQQAYSARLTQQCPHLCSRPNDDDFRLVKFKSAQTHFKGKNEAWSQAAGNPISTWDDAQNRGTDFFWAKVSNWVLATRWGLNEDTSNIYRLSCLNIFSPRPMWTESWWCQCAAWNWTSLFTFECWKWVLLLFYHQILTFVPHCEC